MARLPTVAIVGRPNTGKSTLFNRLVDRRQAIISDVPGTTRDHVTSRIETEELDYLLVDTGGMGGGTEDKDFEDDVHAQSVLALEHADLILFTVNSREELTKSDYAIVSLLRKNRKQHVPVILVITKADNTELTDNLLPQYWQLAVADEIVPISALNRLGIDELQEKILEKLKKLHFKKEEADAQENQIPRIAIIGKPNVGKSSLVNALMSDPQRKASPRLVSDVPGTTRDSTDTIIRHKEREFIVVDTAGLRRQARVEEDIESYATLRTVQALEQADIAVLLLDATEEISKQDKRIAALAVERGKSLIILLNKIDVISSEQKAERMREIEVNFQFCRWAPVIQTSTVTREGILKMFDLVDMLQRNRTRRIPISELNRWFLHLVEGQPLGPIGKAKHITQAEGIPPTFVIFVRNPKLVQVSQLRFIENRLRETFDFEGTPVRWVTKGGRAR